MSLWSEYDNQHPQSGAARPTQTRRLTEQGIVSAVRDWLLNDYVPSYCRSLAATRIYRRCYWVDALGAATRHLRQEDGASEEQPQNGKGRKKTTTEPIPPVLQPLVSLSSVLAQEQQPIALYGLLLDAARGKRKALPAQVVNIPRESGIVHASWLEIAPHLLKEIDQSPGIFLLNPFGQTIFTTDDLAPLYQRAAPTELCLLLSHKQITAHLLAARRTTEQATTLTNLLRSDRWKALPGSESAETEQAVDGFMDLLITSLQKHFLFVQRIPFEMRTRPAVVERTPYTLLFATRRQDSLASMNDASCLYRRRLDTLSHQGVLGEEWFAAQQQERFAEERELLYQRALLLGQKQRTRRWPDLRQQLLLASFGRFTIDEYNEIIQRLLTSGAVRCESKRNSIVAAPPSQYEVNRATSPNAPPIPGNGDSLLWK